MDNNDIKIKNTETKRNGNITLNKVGVEK